MSGIGGPGGIGGPKGPSGPGAADPGHEIDEARELDPAAAAKHLDGLAAEVAAGRLTPQQAVDRLVDELAGNAPMSSTERAELRELMTDLIANDPHLAALVGGI